MRCISISHKKTPVYIREKIAFSQEEKTSFLKNNMVIVSTCNRVEIYFTGYKINDIAKQICEFKNIDYNEFKNYINVYDGDGGILHLYRVASGLESKILGEDEILGQVKDAYYFSHENVELDYEINTVFKGAVTSAKKIKTETLMSKSAVSIGTLVAGFVHKHNAKNVMIIGISGKTGTIIAKNILSFGDVNIFATKRAHKSDVINVNDVVYIPFNKRYEYMDKCHIIISATSSPHYTVTSSKISKYKIENKIFIDLAVPRDIDDDIENNSLFNIDYFESISKSNSELKLKQIDTINSIIEEMIDELKKEMYFHSIVGDLESLDKYNFKQLIYKIRDGMNYDEFKKFINILKE